jgi:hypothetical protein
MHKSKRERSIEQFLDSIITQEEWKNKLHKKINFFYEKYNSELEDYIYIEDINQYNDLQSGGYVRYFNFNDEIKWGGILAKKYNFNDMNMMCLLNSAFKKNTISFEKNYIFYKKHTTQSDKTRKIFLSYLEKYKE